MTASLTVRRSEPPDGVEATSALQGSATFRRRVRIAVLLSPALTVVAVFFVAGLGQALAQSLGYQPFLPGWHWSTRAYQKLWSDPGLRASWWLTLRIATVATITSAVLGVALALGLRALPRGRKVATGVMQANLAVPHLVGALCMLLLLSQSGLLARLGHATGLVGPPSDFPALTADRFGIAIIAEYVWKETPFLAILALAALSRGVDDLTRASQTLGANRWQKLVHVTLPLLAPSVAAGSILVFAFSFGSYEVPYILGRPYPTTLPVAAYQAYTNPDLAARPQAMAVATLISVTSLVIVAAYMTLLSRLSRRSL